MITTNFSDLTANGARQAIYNLTSIYSWETIGSEMISRMSGDEARSFVEDFAWRFRAISPTSTPVK